MVLPPTLSLGHTDAAPRAHLNVNKRMDARGLYLPGHSFNTELCQPGFVLLRCHSRALKTLTPPAGQGKAAPNCRIDKGNAQTSLFS